MASLASLSAAALFVTYATVATGSRPSLPSILGLAYVAGVLCAAGKPSTTSAALSSLALFVAAGAQATVRPGASATEMCGGAAVGIALVLLRQLVGNTALLAAGLDGKLRPLIITLLPTKLVVLIYSASRSTYMGALAAGRYGPFGGAHHPVEVLGLRFRNDLGSAAGMDKDGSLLEWMYRTGAGFALVGTVLDKPHGGNQFVLGYWNPWLPLPFSGAGLNSLGLPSKGVGKAMKNIAAFREKWQPVDFPIGVSIMGHPAQSGQEKLDGVIDCVKQACAQADFIEINESCPNVAHGHGDSSELEARLTAVLKARDEAASADRSKKKVPVLVKLGTLGADPAATCRLMAKIGVDGLVGLNTQIDYKTFYPSMNRVDISALETYTGAYKGGLSGPIVLERSTSQLAAAAKAIAEEDLPLTLIHVGGISEPEDVAASRAVGVPLREWYTGLMHAVATVPADQIYARMTGESKKAA
jgi:dihydroorotate dehydrogenase